MFPETTYHLHILYFCASFQLLSNILTSFRWGDFILTRKGITEILTQNRQSFCKRRPKSFIEKFSDFTFAGDFGHEKNNLFETFCFRNQLFGRISKRTTAKKITAKTLLQHLPQGAA